MSKPKPGRRWLRLARKGWTCGVPYTRWDETHVRRCERRLTRLKKLAALILLMAVSVRAEEPGVRHPMGITPEMWALCTNEFFAPEHKAALLSLWTNVTVDMTRGVTGTTTNIPSDETLTLPDDTNFTTGTFTILKWEPPPLFPRYLAVLSSYTVTNIVRLPSTCFGEGGPLTLGPTPITVPRCPHYPECLKWGPVGLLHIQTNHVIGYLAPGEKPWSDLIPVPLWTNFGAIAEAIKP